MSRSLCVLALLGLTQLAACVDDAPAELTTTTAERGAATDREPVRYCDASTACASACACVNGTCQPDGFGPPPPAGTCAQAPVRACADASDCRSACACVSGTCQADGFGPPPPGDWCALPPPDGYEPNDDVWSGTHYLGQPQTHTFHDGGDEDWIWVYFGGAGTFTFDTAESRGTYLEVYRYDAGTQQFAFVAANDDKCGFWWAPYCWGSRVTTAIAADSLYAARVVNQATVSPFEQDPPSYVLSVW